jgi:hypothetical protein
MRLKAHARLEPVADFVQQVVEGDSGERKTRQESAKKRSVHASLPLRGPA